MLSLNTSAECECGNIKSARATACQRCLQLDGKTPLRMEIIAALEGTDGLTLAELCVDVHGYATRSLQRSMLRMVQVLEREGRVRRYWGEGMEHTCRTYGDPDRMGRRMSGAWRYLLRGVA